MNFHSKTITLNKTHSYRTHSQKKQHLNIKLTPLLTSFPSDRRYRPRRSTCDELSRARTTFASFPGSAAVAVVAAGRSGDWSVELYRTSTVSRCNPRHSSAAGSVVVF